MPCWARWPADTCPNTHKSMVTTDVTSCHQSKFKVTTLETYRHSYNALYCLCVCVRVCVCVSPCSCVATYPMAAPMIGTKIILLSSLGETSKTHQKHIWTLIITLQRNTERPKKATKHKLGMLSYSYCNFNVKHGTYGKPMDDIVMWMTGNTK